ncbi:hypothetical protein [Rhizocola hellebori]|uniref:hypothetical protein n=1 Tax=Rhizocola hellebori TaxID=1392758 RepID=UPI00194455A2|nr:hypothetical protein [Rhizocola hellebori]
MGIDLELADVAAAKYQLRDCQAAGGWCGHEPDCEAHLWRLLSLGPSEFPVRRFYDINETMQLTGMGYDAEPVPWLDFLRDAGEPSRHQVFLRWRMQTVPGKTGIPSFKLLSNDRWLVTAYEIDEALAAYAEVPAEQKAILETNARWASWLEWLALARERGGFEAE